MHILITGGSGFIGSALCPTLADQGHRITVVSRHPQRTAGQFTGDITTVDSLDALSDEAAVDAIINLAGAPIIAKRWTAARKQVLLNSRIDTTHKLIRYIEGAARKPACLISASAVGYYGDQGDQVVTEQTAPKPDFAHSLCERWEQAALEASELGVRVCLLRIGLVAGRGGGFLQRMLLPFKLGLGGPIGAGTQWMPWVHIDDVIGMINWLLRDEQHRGPFNVTAPNPVTNLAFSHGLGRVLHRPARLPLPAGVLKLAMGEMSELLLTGQKALPQRALDGGYTFAFDDLQAALEDITGSVKTV